MALKLKMPLITEQVNRMDIDSFNVDLTNMRFTYIIGMYFDQMKMRNKVIEVPTAELMPYLTAPLKDGETIYSAIKRMLYRHAMTHGHMPDDGVDETAPEAAPETSQESQDAPPAAQ